MKTRTYWVYILGNTSGTLYTGVTNNLMRRMHEHKNHTIEGFTKKYKIDRLLYFEETDHVSTAIAREKEIKGCEGKRSWILFITTIRILWI